MAKVFVVTSGWYSDYSIEAVFSTEAAADKFAGLFRPEDASVEEFVLDDPEYISLTECIFAVTMARDGTSSVTVSDPVLKPSNGSKPHFRKRFVVGEGGVGTRREKREMCIHELVRAKDEQHAIKIVNERRARYIAENMWPEQEAE